MSDHTTSALGLQNAIKGTLTGAAADTKAYIDKLITPTFWSVQNGQRLSYDEWLKKISDLRPIISDYEPKV